MDIQNLLQLFPKMVFEEQGCTTVKHPVLNLSCFWPTSAVTL